MTLSRTDEIRQVASEWEFDKRIHAPRAARLLSAESGPLACEDYR